MEAENAKRGSASPKLDEVDFMKEISPKGLVVGVVIGLITLFLIFFLTRRKSSRRSVIICGPCEAGKTTIFAQLLVGKPVETFTSAKENSGLYDVPGYSPLKLVDLPGHERLRTKCVNEVKSQVRAIIYVVDASTIQKQLRDATEYLFKLLSDPVINGNRTPVNIVCNKQDINASKGVNVIRRELEKELNLLRATHSRTLHGTDGNPDSGAELVQIGKAGEDFEFADLPMKVKFSEASALDTSEDSLSDLKAWMTQIAA